MNRVPDYETPLEEALFEMFIMHGTPELGRLWLQLVAQPDFGHGMNGLMVDILEDIALVRADKGVII